MQWLDTFVLVEAASSFILASLNCFYFAGYTRRARSSRRVGALALALIEAALALEALLFLSQAPPGAPSVTRAVAVSLVRGALLVSAAVVSLLIWRNAWPRR